MTGFLPDPVVVEGFDIYSIRTTDVTTSNTLNLPGPSRSLLLLMDSEIRNVALIFCSALTIGRVTALILSNGGSITLDTSTPYKLKITRGYASQLNALIFQLTEFNGVVVRERITLE